MSPVGKPFIRFQIIIESDVREVMKQIGEKRVNGLRQYEHYRKAIDEYIERIQAQCSQ